MIITENGCINCGMPCLYDACKYWKVTSVFCDKCGEEMEESNTDEYGTDLCDKCIDEMGEENEND